MGAFFEELLHVGIYKGSQGRIARQATFGAVVLIIAVGLYRMSVLLKASKLAVTMIGIQFWLPMLLLVAGVWIAYRMVNFPVFADFLIGVEAEMNKVSWPTRSELVRASIVVLVMLVLVAFLLAGFDLFWHSIFKASGLL